MTLARALAAIATVVLAASAHAAYTLSVRPSNPYAEIVERGSISLRIELAAGDVPPTEVLDCAPPTIRTALDRHFDVVLHAVAAAQWLPPCYNAQAVDFGEMAAGAYSVSAQVVDASGAVVAQTDATFDVLPVAGRCNALPMLQPQIIAEHATLQPQQLQQRLRSDPAYAARLGYPLVTGSLRNYQGNDWALIDYPPLRNPTESRVLLDDSGEFRHVEANNYACGLPPPDAKRTVIEFYNASLDHYFYGVDPGEIAALDDGTLRGWSRTGESFDVIWQPGCMSVDPAAPSALGVVYRFYGIPGRGPDSHFFTRDRSECYAVDRSDAWLLEGVPFWAWPVDAHGACPDPARQLPLYRAWKPYGDSNHRFSTRPVVMDAMSARGWIAEGPAMCVVAP